MAWILVLVAIYLAVLCIVAWISLHPYRIPVYLTPAVMGAPEEETSFESDGNRLRGLWVPAEGARTVVILAHGYMMNRAELAPVAFVLWQHGVSSLLFDFRVHGKSGGKLCTAGNLERNDIRTAVEHARTLAPGAKVVLLGSSMGAAASALACGDDPTLADALILDSAYSRLDGAITGWWRFVGGPVAAFLLYPVAWISAPFAKFNPRRIDVAAALARLGEKPVLFVHGTRDSLALPSEAQRNFDATPGPKSILWLEGYGHSEGRWEQPAKYFEAVLGFLRTHRFLDSDQRMTV